MKERFYFMSIIIAMFTLFSFVMAQQPEHLCCINTSQASWGVPISIKAEDVVFTRTFGGDPNATYGFDLGRDVADAPPGMTYYAYFEITEFPNYLGTDIRGLVSPYNTDIEWTIKIVNATGKTTTMNWDPANLPSEGTFTLEGTDTPVDMRSQNSVTFGEDKTLKIKYKLESTMVSPLSTATGIPDFYHLSQNYPNPFNPETTIEFQLPQTAEIILTIYDIQGHAVRQLVHATKSAGSYVVHWDGRVEMGQVVAAGTYFYRIEIIAQGAEQKSYVDVRKMIFMK